MRVQRAQCERLLVTFSWQSRQVKGLDVVVWAIILTTFAVPDTATAFSSTWCCFREPNLMVLKEVNGRSTETNIVLLFPFLISVADLARVHCDHSSGFGSSATHAIYGKLKVNQDRGDYYPSPGKIFSAMGNRVLVLTGWKNCRKILGLTHPKQTLKNEDTSPQIASVSNTMPSINLPHATR